LLVATLRDVTQVWRNSRFSVEDAIEVEVTVAREILDDDLFFIDQVVEIANRLMWSFNWPDRAMIKQRTAEILHANTIP